MAVTDWSTTASSNSTVGGVSIAENWSANTVNNAIRGLMAEVAQGIADGDFATVSGLQAEDATLTALAGLTIADGKLIKGTGTDTFSTIDISSYGETLINLASAAALRTALGAVTVTASSISANGYVTFDISGTAFTIQWGSGTAAANGSTTVSYPTSFGSFSRAVISSARTQTNAQDNNPGVTSCGLTSFNVYSAADQSLTFFYIAVGS